MEGQVDIKACVNTSFQKEKKLIAVEKILLVFGKYSVYTFI